MPRRTDCTDRRGELFQADGLRRGLPVRLNSGAALPTVVGLLVEVSVMLSGGVDREIEPQLVRARRAGTLIISG